MKLISSLFFLIGIVLFFSSCECTKVDCAEENPTILFRVIDAVDSTDLVFGPDASLSFQDFKLFSLDDMDTTFIDITSTLINSETESLFIEFRTPDNTLSRIFLDYGDTEVDMLDITSSRYSDSCCEGRRITNVAHNGIEVFSNSPSSIVLLLK